MLRRVYTCFFSSRRRHTRCVLVTGVQTCALPISPAGQNGAFLSAFTDGRAWLLALIYFGEISGLYGCVFWLPQIIGKLSSGIGADLATWLSIVPFAVEIGRAHV